MVVGIVTTLNFIVFFTPGQLSPFSIHIIKWQLSANSINILMEENFGFVRKCIPIACGRCVGLYQLTHLRTYAACTGENFIHCMHLVISVTDGIKITHWGIFLFGSRNSNMMLLVGIIAVIWYHRRTKIFGCETIDFVPGYLDR